MLLINCLFFVVTILIVKSVPIDERKISNRNTQSTRRATLETYRYNHPPSASIPVSVVFEENDTINDKSSKSLKPHTETSNKQPSPLQVPSSLAIPVSVVFEGETPGNDKSENVNTKNQDKNPVPPNEPYSVAIPVSVVFEEEISDNAESEKVNTKSRDKNPVPSNESYSVAIPVSVVFEEETSVSVRSRQSKKPNPKTFHENKISSPETIPVSVVFGEKQYQSDEKLKSDKQAPQIKLEETETITGRSNISTEVEVIFKEKGILEKDALESEELIHKSPNINQSDTKESNNVKQRTGPPNVTSTESVISDNDIEVLKTSTASAKPKLRKEPSKVIFKPQPKQYYRQLEYQIPVAVVYDEPINVVHTSRRLNNSKERLRGRNSRRRRPTSTSTTETAIDVKISENDTQNKPLKNELFKSDTGRRRHQVTQAQEKFNDKVDIPVFIKFTDNENQNSQPKRREDKPSTSTITVPKTEASLKKLTNNTKTPLQTQNRNSSFKAQQKEERRQDNESSRKRERDPVVPIIKSDSYAYGNSGSFSYSYEGGDGTKAFEKGELKTFENDKTGEAVAGGFSYKDKDGNDISLSYTADENGYRPVGDHLPTPPPIPIAIQRALDYLATKTTPEPVTKSGEA